MFGNSCLNALTVFGIRDPGVRHPKPEATNSDLLALGKASPGGRSDRSARIGVKGHFGVVHCSGLRLPLLMWPEPGHISRQMLVLSRQFARIVANLAIGGKPKLGWAWFF